MPPRRPHFLPPPVEDEPLDDVLENAPRRRVRRMHHPPEDDPAPAAPAEDTSGDAAFARRMQLDYDAERDRIRRQQREQEANRRAAIQQVAREEQARAQADLDAMMQRYNERADAGRFALGPAAAARYGVEIDIPGYVAGDPREQGRRPWHLPPIEDREMMMRRVWAAPELFLQELRARQEQSVQDSWGGINFVPRQNPLLGFTFDFDKDAGEEEPTEIVRLDFDDDAPIIEELKATGSGTLGRTLSSVTDKGLDGLTSLVCASCYLPLRVSQGQRNDGDRVFALRCGHLVDKRCLDDISQPKPEPSVQSDDVKPGFIKLGSGSTSRKDGNFVVHGDYGTTETPVASTSALPPIVSPSSPSSPTVPVASSPMIIANAASGSARLPARTTRSSTRAAPAPPVDESSSDDPADTPEFSLRSGRGRPRGGNQRKRKAPPTRASKPIKKLAKPEEKREYKWLCPVVACGREHYSEEIGGVWKPKEGMTTQLFV